MIYILNQGSNCIMNKQCWNFCETASYKAEKKTVENGQNSHIYLVYCTVLFLQMINHEQYTRYCIYDNVLNMWTKYNFFHLPPPFRLIYAACLWFANSGHCCVCKWMLQILQNWLTPVMQNCWAGRICNKRYARQPSCHILSRLLYSFTNPPAVHHPVSCIYFCKMQKV